MRQKYTDLVILWVSSGTMRIVMSLSVSVLLGVILLGSCSDEESGSSFQTETLSVDFKSYIEDYSYISSGSEGYQTPDASALTSFAELVDRLLSANYEAAASIATTLSATLYQVTDTGNSNSTYYCLIFNSGSDSGRGIFCIQPSSSRLHHIAAPHPLYDSNTNLVAVDILRGSSFRYLSISTAHRCSSGTYSSCSGTTSVCGSSESYRESDMAHNSNTFFDLWSQKISDSSQSTYTIQIHGCGSTSCPSGTGSDVVIRASVGTTTDLASSALSNLFNADIKARIQAEKPSATTHSCNLTGNENTLCATTNTQGRYINGSTSDPCGTAATPDETSRFLHIEANSDIRNDDGGSDTITPQMIVDSINQVF